MTISKFPGPLPASDMVAQQSQTFLLGAGQAQRRAVDRTEGRQTAQRFGRCPALTLGINQ